MSELLLPHITWFILLVILSNHVTPHPMLIYDYFRLVKVFFAIFAQSVELTGAILVKGPINMFTMDMQANIITGEAIQVGLDSLRAYPLETSCTTFKAPVTSYKFQ